MSIAGAIALIAIGAILRYAVNDEIESIDLETVGLILMIAGAAGLLLTFLWLGINRRRGDVAYDRGRADEYRRREPPPP